MTIEQMYEVIPLTREGEEAGNFGPYLWGQIPAVVATMTHGYIVRPIK